uniref:Transmembrane protein n=1 Tax=Cacopsylla melanoneura TaxID=428564 RepID=A0A8D8RXU6_9HEMI
MEDYPFHSIFHISNLLRSLKVTKFKRTQINSFDCCTKKIHLLYTCISLDREKKKKKINPKKKKKKKTFAIVDLNVVFGLSWLMLLMLSVSKILASKFQLRFQIIIRTSGVARPGFRGGF